MRKMTTRKMIRTTRTDGRSLVILQPDSYVCEPTDQVGFVVGT
jgi:hypothetical protein